MTSEPDSGVRKGVVFVHGVGGQRRSDTLLDFGGPLVNWLSRWYTAQDADSINPQVRSVTLNFSPLDEGAEDSIPHAEIRLANGDVWLLAEAWWAGSTRRPSSATMLAWAIKHWWDVIRQLAWTTYQRIERLRPRESKQHVTDPAIWARAIDLLNALVLLLIYIATVPLGFVFLLVLAPIAIFVPIPAVQNFVLVGVLQSFLQVNAGEFYTYLEDELQSANMRRRVADALHVLVTSNATDITIVAHSEGAVVSHGMLSDPTDNDDKRCVKKLITLGAGLNKSWLVRPDLRRLQRPLPAWIHWLDFWGSYDPVPAGRLMPPVVDGRPARVFQPDTSVVRLQHLVPAAGEAFWPVSEQVTNQMNVATDHGGYWSNDEQVVLRVAAEIDQPYYQDSVFWKGYKALPPAEDGSVGTPAALGAAVRARRVRISVLAALRLLAGALALSLAAAFGGQVADLLRVSGAADVVLGLFGWAKPLPGVGILGDLVPRLGSLVVAVVLLSLPAIAAYLVVRALFWEPWDHRARRRALQILARRGRGSDTSDALSSLEWRTPSPVEPKR